MADAENGSGRELETIFPPDSAENGQKEIAQNGSSPRRRSGFGNPAWWDQIDPETGLTNRERKSQWAKKMVEEGRIGGRQPGAGRPRKVTVAEIVTEKAQEKGDRIASKLLDMALNNRSPSVNLGAIDRLKAYEDSYQKNMRDDEKELLKLSGKSLDAALQDVLNEYGVKYDYEIPPEDIEDDE